MMRFITTTLLFITLFFTAVGPAYAVTAKTEKLSAADIKNIESYLNNITTLKANFLQIAPDGTISTGIFYLSRPGKLRWEYNPPTPILIVANGSLITYYDSELKQASYISSKSTLAAFLTRKDIRFSGDVEITKSSKAAGLMRVSIIQKGKKDEGELTLVYEAAPLALKKIEVIDASGQLTTVTLSNLQYKVKLDNSLFILQNLPIFKPRNS